MHSFWLEHYQNYENITDTKLNLSGRGVAFWQATYYLKYQDNAPNHQRFKEITKCYTKQWTLENVDVGLICQFWLKMWALFEMGMLGTYNIWFEMWVLVKNVGFGFTWFGRKRLFIRSGDRNHFLRTSLLTHFQPEVQTLLGNLKIKMMNPVSPLCTNWRHYCEFEY